jgi:uncharacterized protein
MYANGEGVPKDDTEAMKWSRKAADRGNAAAQLNLGLMYAKGLGVPQDFVQAYMWLNLSGAHNGDAAHNRDTLAARMTPAQIAEAQKLARERKPTMPPLR